MNEWKTSFSTTQKKKKKEEAKKNENTNEKCWSQHILIQGIICFTFKLRVYVNLRTEQKRRERIKQSNESTATHSDSQQQSVKVYKNCVFFQTKHT